MCRIDKQTLLVCIIPMLLLSTIVLASGVEAVQPTDPLTKKQLRQQKRELRKTQKEQLHFKADSIKIAAMLQLRNATEVSDKDSLKKVMKEAKRLAEQTIQEQEALKEYKKEIAPYLDHYRQYKAKLDLLDSGNHDALLNEAKSIGLEELNKNDEFKELSGELSPYTEHLSSFNKNALDSANRKETLNQLKNIGVDELKMQDQYKEVAEQINPYTQQLNKFKDQGNPLDSANKEQTLNTLKEIGITELERQDQYKEIKAELTPYIDSPYLKGLSLQDLDSMSLDSLKSLGRSTFAQLEKELEKELLSREEFKELNTGIAGMDKLKGLPESYRKQCKPSA